MVLGTVQNSSTIANAIKPFGELEHVPQLATISVTSTFLLKRLSGHIRVSRFNQPQAQCLFGTVFRFSTFDSRLSSSQLLFGGSSVWLPSHSGCRSHTHPLFLSIRLQAVVFPSCARGGADPLMPSWRRAQVTVVPQSLLHDVHDAELWNLPHVAHSRSLFNCIVLIGRCRLTVHILAGTDATNASNFAE